MSTVEDDGLDTYDDGGGDGPFPEDMKALTDALREGLAEIAKALRSIAKAIDSKHI